MDAISGMSSSSTTSSSWKTPAASHRPQTFFTTVTPYAAENQEDEVLRRVPSTASSISGVSSSAGSSLHYWPRSQQPPPQSALRQKPSSSGDGGGGSTVTTIPTTRPSYFHHNASAASSSATAYETPLSQHHHQHYNHRQPPIHLTSSASTSSSLSALSRIQQSKMPAGAPLPTPHHHPRQQQQQQQQYQTPGQHPRPLLVLDASAGATSAHHQKQAAATTSQKQNRGGSKRNSFLSWKTGAVVSWGKNVQTPTKTAPASTGDNATRRRSHNDSAGAAATGTLLEQQPLAAADEEGTATAFARGAPQAGYLQKLGSNVQTFKRRFFVLQPATHLYYFLSPADTTPRGCLDLTDCWVEALEQHDDEQQHHQSPATHVSLMDQDDDNNDSDDSSILPPAKERPYRFALCWPGRERIVLEARSKATATQWMQSLQQERLPFAQEALRKARNKCDAQKGRIAALERQVANYRLMEKDRDGALQDAARWKEEFEKLDESARLLTLHVRRQTAEQQRNVAESTSTRRSKENEEAADEHHLCEEEKKDENEATETNSNKSLHETSLLDDAVEDDNGTNAMDGEYVMTVPGTHFGGLYNACQQLQENFRLASGEAASALQDLMVANEQIESLQVRMNKAEKHLCKLWEENCSIRKTLKQKKREKRVLVREVKNLQEAVKAREEEVASHVARGMPVTSAAAAEAIPIDDSSINGSDDEEKLINELEEHVMSSIRLHEHILGANGNSATGKHVLNRLGTNQPLVRPPSSSKCLFDESDDTSCESNVAEEEKLQKDVPEEVDLGSVSSTCAEASDAGIPNPVEVSGLVVHLSVETEESPQSTPDRPNPLLDLDETSHSEAKPNVCAASSRPESSKSMVTSNGQATSSLSCPLADVVDRNAAGTDLGAGNEDLQMYHLTFYSRKIGLQFQKVPPPPTKPKGLLTDALTADLNGAPSWSEKTAVELRRIATISALTKSDDHITMDDQVLDVAKPVDAVLVCGFYGFDDSSNNVRPKLGARLVAFDGVSVEVGRWTFESIRKSIQARGRPLTLSFRNDFLTTEQRTILTKAVKDVNASAPPPPRPNLQYHSMGKPGSRPSSATPSVTSHETDVFVNDDNSYSPVPLPSAGEVDADNWSVSVSGSSTDHRPTYVYPHSFSGPRSVSSVHSGGNFRSFSEAGSSASLLSAVAPLVAQLLPSSADGSGRKMNKARFTPEYLRGSAPSLEDTPQHQDFLQEQI